MGDKGEGSGRSGAPHAHARHLQDLRLWPLPLQLLGQKCSACRHWCLGFLLVKFHPEAALAQAGLHRLFWGAGSSCCCCACCEQETKEEEEGKEEGRKRKRRDGAKKAKAEGGVGWRKGKAEAGHAIPSCQYIASRTPKSKAHQKKKERKREGEREGERERELNRGAVCVGGMRRR